MTAQIDKETSARIKNDSFMLVDSLFKPLAGRPKSENLQCTLNSWGIEEFEITKLFQFPERPKILDWYHLVKNLHKVGGSITRLNQAEALLCQGQLGMAIALFRNCQQKQAKSFCEYLLHKHHHRIGNYKYFQVEEAYSIG